MAPTAEEGPFHCPVFEGSEKRLSVTFAAGAGTPREGLRALRRDDIDGMLDLAACQVVSHRRNEHFDAYVLSESSLFVYPGAQHAQRPAGRRPAAGQDPLAATSGPHSATAFPFPSLAIPFLSAPPSQTAWSSRRAARRACCAPSRA
jgi:hypothetical protein